MLISYVINDVEFDSSLKHIISPFLKLRAITCSISALNDFSSLFLVSISQCNDISVQTFVCSEPVAGGLISEKPSEVFICVTICSFVNQRGTSVCGPSEDSVRDFVPMANLQLDRLTFTKNKLEVIHLD